MIFIKYSEARVLNKNFINGKYKITFQFTVWIHFHTKIRTRRGKIRHYACFLPTLGALFNFFFNFNFYEVKLGSEDLFMKWTGTYIRVRRTRISFFIFCRELMSDFRHSFLCCVTKRNLFFKKFLDF